ncbi:cytochrome P450 [Mycobacteroides abscessus subsp. bolletii]|uniref:cytochrome P450 n=1 Tax=Mycobacteroides abscessus TaxID=36809 RepID=UPI0009A634C4|nr:cytochrome P450 [Mycobacteroides abscessus]SKX96321.1 cytochrome P450 [Mycobacteroides abscessus subsp. bolletii]
MTETRVPHTTGILDASDPGFYAESNRPTFVDIHRVDPVYWVDARYTQPFWNVCRGDLIRQIGQDSELFTTEFGVHLNAAAFEVKSGGGQSGGSAASNLPVALRPANILDADNHRRVRSPINVHFRPRAALDLEPAVREEVQGILDAIEPGLEADFMRTFATRVPLLVTTRLLGVSTDREHDFEMWANTILESFEPGATPDFAAIGDMVAFFSSEVAARKKAPCEDLITQLTQTGLSDDEVVMWCWLLLVAGLETTGNVIGAGLDLLLRHPDSMRRLVADPSLIQNATAEMLRVVTPGRYIRRTATADTEIGGHRIRKGDAVVMNLTVANHDPEVFTSPLEFDIERPAGQTHTFSWGPHRCIGAAVAQVETQVAFEELLARFGNIEARGPAVYRPSLATAVVESMPVAFL